MSEPSQQSAEPSLVDSFLDNVKKIGLRIVVHISAFFCAGVVANFIPGYTAAAMYVGLICLVARDIRLSTEWLTPAGLGVLQLVLCYSFGLPFHEAVFWGGAQAWTQRLFMKKYALGTEWVTAVFLFPLALKFSATSLLLGVTSVSFAVIALGGVVFWQIRTRLAAKKLTQETGPVVDITDTSKVKSAAKEAMYSEYKTSIAKLRSKQLLLPRSVQPTMLALTKSADAIVLCMKEDNRDTESGEKFLHRYLPATHSVLDNYCRLAGNSIANVNASEDINQALRESEEVLQRLEQAFSHEHKSLLRNNIEDFSADLKVLDTLLKMEGR